MDSIRRVSVLTAYARISYSVQQHPTSGSGNFHDERQRLDHAQAAAIVVDGRCWCRAYVVRREWKPGLRRQSAKRREALRKEQEAAAEPDQIADQR